MTTMPFADLEHAYEALAQGIDKAGAEHETLFLAKLALALAHRLGDIGAVRACIAMSLEDLDLEDLPGTGATGG